MSIRYVTFSIHIGTVAGSEDFCERLPYDLHDLFTSPAFDQQGDSFDSLSVLFFVTVHFGQTKD